MKGGIVTGLGPYKLQNGVRRVDVLQVAALHIEGIVGVFQLGSVFVQEIGLSIQGGPLLPHGFAGGIQLLEQLLRFGAASNIPCLSLMVIALKNIGQPEHDRGKVLGIAVRVIHAGVGAISKSDVDLADASNAIIIGFNVRPDNVAKEEAAATKVEMRMYRVIYDAINDVTDAMKGMLAPKFREVSLGELQVRQVYKISNVGTVAGCRVTSGKITRDSKVRVVRDGIVITEDEIASLKRFKDDAKEVAEGYECGVTLAKFADVKEGDVYEAFKMEEYRD